MRQQDYQLAMFGAHQGERFHRVERLRPFYHYAKQLSAKPPEERLQTAAERLAIFEALASSGVPLKITRI